MVILLFKCTYCPGFGACSIMHTSNCRTSLSTVVSWATVYAKAVTQIGTHHFHYNTENYNALQLYKMAKHLFKKTHHIFMVNLWLRSTVTRTSSIIDKLSMSWFIEGWIYVYLIRCVWTMFLLLSRWVSTVCDWSSIIQRRPVPPIDGSISTELKYAAIETRGYPQRGASVICNTSQCRVIRLMKKISQIPTKINRCDGI